VDIHGLEALELAGGSEGRHLDGDLAVAVVGIIVVPPAALLLRVPVLGIDEAHREGALGPAGLVDLTSSLARGSHVDVGRVVRGCDKMRRLRWARARGRGNGD
jgi:hypothetical protein